MQYFPFPTFFISLGYKTKLLFMFICRINVVIKINIFWNVKPWSYLDESDLTPETNETGNLVSNRHASDETSLSDHRHICFQRGNTAITWVTFRDPKITNCEPYKGDWKANLETMSWKISMIWDINLAVDQL